MKNIRRILSLLLAVCLLLSFAVPAFAEEGTALESGEAPSEEATQPEELSSPQETEPPSEETVPVEESTVPPNAVGEAPDAASAQDGAGIMPLAWQNGESIYVYETFTHLTLDGYYGAWGHKYGSFPCLATTSIAYGSTTLPSGGEWIYCIEFETSAEQGSTKFYTLENCGYWKNFSDIARSGITYALMYGCPYYANNLYAYAATQVIVWEYQLGLRTTPADRPSASSGRGFYGTLSSSSQVKSAYDAILAEMTNHMVKPSVDGRKVTLKGFGRENGVTITDSGSKLQYDTWTVSGSVTGLHVEQSGNNLFVYADESFGANASKNVTLVRKAPAAAQVALGAYAGNQFVCIGRPNDPMSISITVETEASGILEIIKTSDDGNVANISFELEEWVSGIGYCEIGTYKTNASGKISIPNLSVGTKYRVSENVPEGYETEQQSQEITIKSGTNTLTFVNHLAPRELEIIKISDDGNVEGITFTIEEWVPGIGYVRIGTYKTDPTGRITVPNLTVGTKYRVTENVPENYEAEQQSQEITIQAGTNTLTFVNHLAVRDLEIIKTSTDGKVSGIEFTVKDSNGKVVGTGKTNSSGKLTMQGLRIGSTYTVTETVPEGYICTKNPQTITIVEGTNSVTFENRPIFGDIELTKVDEEYPENKLTSAEFTATIQKDGKTSTQKMTEVKDSTGKGTGVYRLEHIAYGSICTIRETAAPAGFVLSTETFTVTIKEEKTYTVSSANFDAVINRPIKGSLQIIKVDRDGETPLEGAGFRVFDSAGKQVAEGYTDATGKLTFENLRYGNYTYQEFSVPEGFVLDDTVYDFSILQDGQVISVQRENDAEGGSIQIHKVNTEGKSLSGVSFLLEYSTDDGQTYQPVFSRGEDDPVSVGGCTSEGLQSGVLTTGEDGIAVFTGLRINTQTGSILYRLTETETQADYQLLTGPAFEGELSADEEIDVELTVVNNHNYELPATGNIGFRFVSLSVVLIGLAALTLVISLRKKKQGA